MAKYFGGWYHPIKDAYTPLTHDEVVMEVLRMLDRAYPRLMVRGDLAWIQWDSLDTQKH